VIQPYEDYGLQKYVEWTPNPNQQFEFRRFKLQVSSRVETHPHPQPSPSARERELLARGSSYVASGIQLPWKPNGTRCGSVIVATGFPVKSAASRITRSLVSLEAS